jgi:hypothetical protein
VEQYLREAGCQLASKPRQEVVETLYNEMIKAQHNQPPTAAQATFIRAVVVDYVAGRRNLVGDKRMKRLRSKQEANSRAKEQRCVVVVVVVVVVWLTPQQY